jgi:hypothetical protein
VDVNFEADHSMHSIRMHNPPYPGEVPCLDPFGIGVTESAEALAVSRKIATRNPERAR